MSVALPYISGEFHLAPWQSGMVLSAFFASYSISQIPGGILADLFGVRRVATISLVWWSAFTALTGAAANFTQMLVARFIFGLGEGVFPSCVFKSIALWFPKRERATANAIKMAAAPLGSALAPLVVVGIMSIWGWRHVFYVLFIPGFVIAIILWLFVANSPAESKYIDAEELSEINEGEQVADGAVTKITMSEVLRQPNILRYFLALFAYDIAYWGFTSWLPTYLVKARGFSMVQMGLAASLPFVAGTVGCVLGGWLSDRFLKNSRKLPIMVSQLAAAFLLGCSYFATSSLVLIVCQTLAGFFLNFFFSTFWALPMNTVPRRLMGVASGFINMAGQIAAFISPILIGYLVGIAGGSFGLTFGLLVGSLLVSCAIVTTIRDMHGSSAKVSQAAQ
jgi:MFS family permease